RGLPFLFSQEIVLLVEINDDIVVLGIGRLVTRHGTTSLLLGVRGMMKLRLSQHGPSVFEDRPSRSRQKVDVTPRARSASELPGQRKKRLLSGIRRIGP